MDQGLLSLSTYIKIMPLSEGMIELGSCLTRIIHRDNTLTNVIIKPSCLTACNIYEPNESDDVDSVDAEENSINRAIYDLNVEVSGSREWFTFLGVMIANLTNLTQLTFDGVDPDAAELERFWAGISASPSLTSLNFANMNLERCEEILGGTVNAPSLSSIVFNDCTIPHDIGYVLHDVLNHDSLTTIQFNRCRLSKTTSMQEIVDFAGYLAPLTSITSLLFTSCSLDAIQSMCLNRSLQEERVKLGLGLVDINFDCVEAKLSAVASGQKEQGGDLLGLDRHEVNAYNKLNRDHKAEDIKKTKKARNKDYIERNIHSLEQRIITLRAKHVELLEGLRRMTSVPRMRNSFGRYDEFKKEADERLERRVSRIQSEIDALNALK